MEMKRSCNTFNVLSSWVWFGYPGAVEIRNVLSCSSWNTHSHRIKLKDKLMQACGTLYRILPLDDHRIQFNLQTLSKHESAKLTCFRYGWVERERLDKNLTYKITLIVIIDLIAENYSILLFKNCIPYY